jgi:predicted LPLAT superfamily acyltransferase
MKPDFYNILVQAANRLGPWVFVAVARIIAAGYFLLPRRTVESRRLYSLLFPGRSRFFHLWCTFRQFQNFTTIHSDRYRSNGGQPAEVTAGDMAIPAAGGGVGAILLMSHFGNWEMAARVLMRDCKDTRLLLYMGVKEKEGVEKTQKEELRQAGVRIIAADQNTGSPFAVVDGIRLLREGGIVSMTGDVLWRAEQRCLTVRFLGGTVRIPEAPFVFALTSGAPISVFFAFRTGTNRYHLQLSDPIPVQAAGRAERKEAIARAAQRYADLLEEVLRAHPLEWYHFDRFVHGPEAQSAAAGRSGRDEGADHPGPA